MNALRPAGGLEPQDSGVAWPNGVLPPEGARGVGRPGRLAVRTAVIAFSVDERKWVAAAAIDLLIDRPH